MGIEFAVLKPEHEALLIEAERSEARRGLALYEFDVDAHLRGEVEPAVAVGEDF